MKRTEWRKTPHGRQLSTTSRTFQDALNVANARGREGRGALQTASYIAVHGLLTQGGHIVLEQDGAIECPRCSRSGSHYLEVDRLVCSGNIFTHTCAEGGE